MKKILKHIALFLIAGSFLTSATGVYLTIHFCSSENVTVLFLFAAVEEEPCEHHVDNHKCREKSAGNNADSENTLCCTLPVHEACHCPKSPEMAECCSNTVIYIAVEDRYVRTEQPETHISYNLMHPGFEADMMYTPESFNLISPAVSINHSPGLYGKGLTLFNCTLLL